MIKIKVLLENYSVNNKFKAKHGFSILLEHYGKNILLDVGPDNKFIKNASTMGIDLSIIDLLFLSHSHNDHTGGINTFIKNNEKALIYLMDNINNKYYLKIYFLFIYIGLKLNKKYFSRIIQVKDDLIIENKIFFVKNIISENKKPTLNKMLFKYEAGKKINDTFEHEGILVLEDNNELVIFNSCSHNGILNIIESVKMKIPNKIIRSYVGGLHLGNVGVKFNESNEYLDNLIEKIKNLNIKIYSGHCTGKYALNYMKNKLGNMVYEINTGMEIEV